MPFVPANIRSKSRREHKAALISRALFAQTQKGYRAAFLKRVVKHDALLITEELASQYKTISGKEVTVDQLRAEAAL
jgi:hypothetical protein